MRYTPQAIKEMMLHQGQACNCIAFPCECDPNSGALDYIAKPTYTPSGYEWIYTSNGWQLTPSYANANNYQNGDTRIIPRPVPVIDQVSGSIQATLDSLLPSDKKPLMYLAIGAVAVWLLVKK